MPIYNDENRRCTFCKQIKKEASNRNNKEIRKNDTTQIVQKQIALMLDPTFLGNQTPLNLITPKKRTLFCAKHQRVFSRSIKTLREIGFLNH